MHSSFLPLAIKKMKKQAYIIMMDLLTSQPNDHLDVIFGFFCGLDVIRMRSTSRRLASFANKHWPAISQQHNETFANAYHVLISEWNYNQPREQPFQTFLWHHLMPGITEVYIGFGNSRFFDQKHRKISKPLFYDSIRDHHIELIVARCGRELQRLCIGSAYPCTLDITDKALLALEDCPKLTMLDVDSRTKLSKKQMASLVAKTRLTELYLNGCSKLVDGADIVCTRPALSVLDLSMCDSLNDGTLARISTYLTLLVRLSLKKCPNITDMSLIAICNRNPNLQSLEITFNSSITDDGIDRSVARRQSLKHLDIRYCGMVTDLAVWALSKHCPLLHRLLMTGCSRITNRSIEFICALPITELRMDSASYISPANICMLQQRYPTADMTFYIDPIGSKK